MVNFLRVWVLLVGFASVSVGHASHEGCRGLLLNAEAFGFGPTAAIAQVFPLLRPHFPRLGYVGEPHTMGLQSKLPYDDLVTIQANLSREKLRQNLASLLPHYSHFFTALDFHLAEIASELGYHVGAYDPLTWFWPQIPSVVRDLSLYAVQDFVGVKTRLQLEESSFPRNSRVIPPLVQPLTRNAGKDRESTVLINLGGLSNPFVPDHVLANFAILLARATYSAALEDASDIVLTTKPEFVRVLQRELRAVTLTPLEIQDQLQRSRLAFMTTGLGNLLEASSAQAPVIWFPPTNDSQGQQLELLKQKGMIDWSLDWTDFMDEPPVNYFQEQSIVMNELRRRMELVLHDGSIQQRLVRTLRTKMAQAGRETPKRIGKLVDEYGQGGVDALGAVIQEWAFQRQANSVSAAQPFQKTWQLGGGLGVHFQSARAFDVTVDDNQSFAAHWPGLQELAPSSVDAEVTISHIPSPNGEVELQQSSGVVQVKAPWGPKLPPDFVHLVYGAARLEWLKRGLFPVHGACIGNDEEGYDLLVGPSGSGKTSLTLYNVAAHGKQVFSGDKTLIRIGADGVIEAVAGTRTITVRPKDLHRWASLEKVNMHTFGDRVTFELPEASYSQKKTARIRRILLVGLNENVKDFSQLSPLSALHTLYPLFADKQREDILIGGSRALFDGSIEAPLRARLAKLLGRGLEQVPVYRATSSLQNISAFLKKAPANLLSLESLAPVEAKTVLLGICGIGNGHHSRQTPLVRSLLAEGHHVVVATYGDSLEFFRQRFPAHPRLQVLEVANPYFVGDKEGLNFRETAKHRRNKINFHSINSRAMDVLNHLDSGLPDLVISDYEMVSAQFAHAKGIRLMTIDQQSKYLVGDFPDVLAGTSYRDEVERLSLFFPTALRRLAVSFFNVPITSRSTRFHVEILPPVIRPEILAAKGAPLSSPRSLLVYMSPQQGSPERAQKWISALEEALPKDMNAHVFLPPQVSLMKRDDGPIQLYPHGDPRFDALLIRAHGVVTTAGHTLLSEAMYLEKPVLAIPLPLYEQQLNADIIERGGFGLRQEDLSVSGLKQFVEGLEGYARNIKEDRTILIKAPGNDLLLSEVTRVLAEPSIENGVVF